MRSVLLFFIAFCLGLLSFLTGPHQANAESNSFTTPVTDANVPKDQHYLAQSVLIEVLAAVTCQLSGIDPVDPNRPCLGINTQTNKLGLIPVNSATPGGLVGIMAGQVSSLYTPTITSEDYVHYLSSNFGIVKKAQAAELCNNDQTTKLGYGYCSLRPLFELWKTARDIAYTFLILVCIFIGLAVMLRIKIDPRTVMTIQNQIPRVIIAVLLITFSYAIAGLMIDAMWTVTYVGINALTKDNNVKIGTTEHLLSREATETLLQPPLPYFSNIFSTETAGKDKASQSGIYHVTTSVANAIGGIIKDIIQQTINAEKHDCGITNLKGCISAAVGTVIGVLADIFMRLIILIAIIIILFKVWWELLKAYIFIIFYSIAGPIWIVFGLIPGRPLGFENWARLMFANLAVFPLVAFVFVTARIFMDVFQKSANPAAGLTSPFIPPLVGQPNMESFGTLMAFGAILMTPGLLTMVKEKLKVPDAKTGGLVTAGLAAGALAPRMAGKAAFSRFTRRYNYQTGEEAGILRSMVAGRAMKSAKRDASGKIIEKEGKPQLKFRFKVAQKLFGKDFGAGPKGQ